MLNIRKMGVFDDETDSHDANNGSDYGPGAGNDRDN